jgi:hypothetical protein
MTTPTTTAPALPADVPALVVPLWAPAAWHTAVAAADHQCACRGQCGAKHKAGAGRCIRTLRGPAAEPLFAVPAEPGSSELIALCRRCADGHETAQRRTVRQAATAALTEAPGLFDLPTDYQAGRTT